MKSVREFQSPDLPGSRKEAQISCDGLFCALCAFLRRTLLPLFLFMPVACAHAGVSYAELEKNFLHPPPSARPWVFWFWLSGNITSNGITADLEAMKRAGI